MSFKPPFSLSSYLARIGATLINFRKAEIKVIDRGYERVTSTIKIMADGSIIASKDLTPTKEEQDNITEDFKTIKLPKFTTIKNTDSLKPLTNGELFLFYDRKKDEINFVQEKIILKSGQKAYIPWSPMSDGNWEKMEPDYLPLWKPRYGSPGSAIMIHEGVKAAKFVTDLLADPSASHPWKEELTFYEHWAMIGGAYSPFKTDYNEIRQALPREVIYVCDRDLPGENAISSIASHWGGRLSVIRFGLDFPETWDMADPMPEKQFNKKGHFIGQQLRDYVMPATWATKKLPQEGKGRPSFAIRQEFAEEWTHVATPEVFIHVATPHRALSAKEFNNVVRPFSDVDDTARLLMRDSSSKAVSLSYNPTKPTGIFAEGNERFFNTYKPSPITAIKGNPQPFIDYLEHLIPGEDDRKEVLRWCATLVCRTDIRMHYSMLLISTTPGVGKSTLGAAILQPLIGNKNTSAPSEGEVTDSKFTGWLHNVRFVLIHEIYSNDSSKAYNALKRVITEEEIYINEKFQKAYQIKNWTTIMAASNSRRALKLVMEDRRWFLPRVVESTRPVTYWRDFNIWLREEDGLGIIRNYMEEWLQTNDPVGPGRHPPHTDFKDEIRREGRSPGMLVVERALAQMKENNSDKLIFTTDKLLINLIKNKLYRDQQNPRVEAPRTIQALSKELGWHVGKIPSQILKWPDETWGGVIISNDKDQAAMYPKELSKAGLKPFNPLEIV